MVGAGFPEFKEELWNDLLEEGMLRLEVVNSFSLGCLSVHLWDSWGLLQRIQTSSN